MEDVMSELKCETCRWFSDKLESAKIRSGVIKAPEHYGRCLFVLAKQPLAKWMTGFGWEAHTRDLFDASLPSGARVINHVQAGTVTTCEAHTPKEKSDD